MDGAGKAPLKSSPIALMLREHAALWRAGEGTAIRRADSAARAVYEALETRGALFFHEIVAATGLLRTHVERALGELAGVGLVTADSFSGLRALLTPPEKRQSLSRPRQLAALRVRRGHGRELGVAGGASLLTPSASVPKVEICARAAQALRRRVPLAARARIPASAVARAAAVYRRLEARGEIRGGRFVGGFGGEQFALPDAVGRLRAVRKLEKSGELVVLCGADPLNLVGILTPEARVPAIARNRILFRDGLRDRRVGRRRGAPARGSDLDDETLRGLLARRASAQGGRSHLRSATLHKGGSTQKKRVYAASIR